MTKKEKRNEQFAYIKPGTKLFHVTNAKNRQSILENGLLGKPYKFCYKQPLVFANVGNEVTLAWWPFCFDETYNWGMKGIYKFNSLGLCNKEFYEYKLQEYDYWEINYNKLNNDWYLDYGAKNYGSVEYYLYTIGNIAPEFLTLHFYKKQQPVIINNNGAASVNLKGGLIPARNLNFHNNIKLNPIGYSGYRWENDELRYAISSRQQIV